MHEGITINCWAMITIQQSWDPSPLLFLPFFLGAENINPQEFLCGLGIKGMVTLSNHMVGEAWRCDVVQKGHGVVTLSSALRHLSLSCFLIQKRPVSYFVSLS